MAARTSRSFSLAFVWLVVAASPTLVKAQGNSFNPYGNSGYADYREFSVPMYSNNPALPGQTRLNGEASIGRPRANSFRQYLEEEESGSDPARRGTSANNPNSRAYKPNDSKENREYAEHMKQREEAFSKALQEKDPVKRAKMLRQIENESAARLAASSKTKTTASNKAPDPNGMTKGATSSKAPAPNGEKRSSAPPPLGSTTRRSTTPPPPVSGVTTARPKSATPATGSSATTVPKPGPPDPSTVAVPPR